MTNHWVDLQNCKTILVEGSNVAENHPMAFKWIRKAQENGATIIHVDPRYTRTSSAADVYARIRPGTDAAFQNTMINHIIVNKLYDEDYVVTHTNALYLGDEAFDFKDGVFSGYDEEHHTYDTKTWGYQLDAKGKPRVAKSLDDPHCVFSRLKTFVSRYTLEMGERITGIPADQIQQIAETMAKNRPGSILYALGMTQHTTGVQGIRVVHHPAAAARQHRQARRRRQRAARRAERAGRVRHGGALQLHARATSTRRPMPSRRSTTTCARTASPTAATSSTRSRRFSETPPPPRTTTRMPGCPSATPSKDYGTMPMFEDALAGKLKMLWIVGQNPAVTLPNLNADVRGDGEARDAGGPGDLGDRDGGVLEASGRRPEVDRHRSDPAARGVLHGEERHHQQLGRHGAMAPRRREAAGAGQARRRDRGPRLPRGARSGQGLEGAEGRDHPARPSGPTPRPRTSCARSTATRCATTRRPASRRAISSARSAISAPTAPRRPAPGSTRASSPTARTSRSAATRTTDPGGLGLYPGFGWTWPNNMRILYNRASCDKDGKPYPGSKPIVWWDEQAKRWTGYDVPDVPVADRRPRHAERPAGLPPGRRGRRAPLRGRLLGPRPEVHRTTGATWPTCRRTARCRRCTSPSRARWKTSFTRA